MENDRIINLETPPILVYQMGKVASLAVCDSLKNSPLINPVYHVHQLADKGFQRKEGWLKFKNIDQMPDDLIFYKKLRSAIDQNKKSTKWKIITLTREPLSVEISGIFENLKVTYREFIDAEDKIELQKIMRFLIENFSGYNVERNYYCNWFDEELKTVFGIDVFDYQYDFKNGFSIVKEDNVEVLIIRFEDLKRGFRQSMQAFFGINDIELKSVNISKNKFYSKDYKFVKRNLKFPREVLETVYSSKYARHFYTQKEREKLIEKWS